MAIQSTFVAKSQDVRIETSAPKKYHHGNLRPTLLSTARELLETQGIESVGLREVARMSGVSANAPYRHFVDKQALLASVAAEGFRELLVSLRAPTDAGDPPAFGSVCKAYIEFVVAHPAVAKLMFETLSGKFSLYPELKGAADECLTVLLNVSAANQRLQVGSKDAFVYAIGVWSMLHGFAMLKSAGALDFPPELGLPSPIQLGTMVHPLASDE